MRKKEKYIEDARNLSPLLKEETKQVLNFVLRGIPVKDPNSLQYYYIPYGKQEVRNFSPHWEEGNAQVYFRTSNGHRSFIISDGDETHLRFPNLGRSFKDEYGQYLPDSWQSTIKLYNKFALWLREYGGDMFDLKADALSLESFESLRRLFWGKDYSYFDSSSIIRLTKDPIMLTKLRRMLQPWLPGDSIQGYAHWGQNRRFGYKNNQIFFYKGENFTQMRLGKGIKKICKIVDYPADDNVIKAIVSGIKAEDAPYELRIVEGEDIEKYYHESAHASTNIGTLSNSCMRYDFCKNEHYFDIYKDNCKMMILVNPASDKIRGRALLWEAIDGTKIMDRVYGADENFHLFFDWAKQNGYWRKNRQTHSSEMYWVDPQGNAEVYNRFVIKLNPDNFHYEKYPYADTFFQIEALYIREERISTTASVGETDRTRKIEYYATNLARQVDSNYPEFKKHLEVGSSVSMRRYSIRSTSGAMQQQTV